MVLEANSGYGTLLFYVNSSLYPGFIPACSFKRVDIIWNGWY